MGPVFSLQRAVASQGLMYPDPEFTTAGDTDAPRPGHPARTPRPACRVGDRDCVSDRGWGEGEQYLNLT